MKSIMSIAILMHFSLCGIAQKPKIMKECTIKLRDNKVKISYIKKGQGDTSLLFLHGWCINGRYWENQINYFSKDFSVYAIDLPGFGKSSADRDIWTIEAYAKDLSAFINSLELKSVILVGHSLSGEIMMQTALDGNSNIIGIVGIDNFKLIDVEFTPEQVKQFQSFFPLLQSDFKANAPVYAENMLFHPSTSFEIKERIKFDFANSDPKIGYSTFFNLIQFSQTVPEKLEKLPYKLYLINSDFTPTNEQGLENHCLKGFKALYISESGHYPMIEKPEEFNNLLSEILVFLSK